MTKKVYEKTLKGIQFKSERKTGEVRIPNYVYDLWVPLLGIQTIGVYAIYCRLERSGDVTGLNQNRLAKALRIGTHALSKANKSLADCGFIEMQKPEGIARLKHFTTTIIVKDPPYSITAKQIETYGGTDYSPLTPWLLGEMIEAMKGQIENLATPEIESSNAGDGNLATPEPPNEQRQDCIPNVLHPSSLQTTSGASAPVAHEGQSDGVKGETEMRLKAKDPGIYGHHFPAREKPAENFSEWLKDFAHPDDKPAPTPDVGEAQIMTPEMIADKIKRYETRYNMTSEDFTLRWRQGMMLDNFDTNDWAILLNLSKPTPDAGKATPANGASVDDGHLSDERVPTKPLQSFKVKAHINEVRYVTASKPLDDDTDTGATAEPVTDGKRLEEKKPRARSAAQMDTDAKVLALAVAFYGSENYAKKDYGVIAKTANSLEESGILRDDFAGYVKWVRGYAKSSGDWTVTLTSLTTGGRMTDYLTRKKAFGPVDVEDSDNPRNRTPQQKTILSPEEQKRYFERIAEREKGMKK